MKNLEAMLADNPEAMAMYDTLDDKGKQVIATWASLDHEQQEAGLDAMQRIVAFDRMTPAERKASLATEASNSH